MKHLLYILDRYTLKEILTRIPEKLWFLIYQKQINQRVYQKSLQKKLLVVEICNDISGIGARLQYALEIIAHCERNSLTPFIKFTYKQDVQDYLSHYFRLKNTINLRPSEEFIKIRTIAELDLLIPKRPILEHEEATRLTQKYLKPRGSVVDEVNRFCCKNFENRKVLGIHYRGTDKYKEANVIDYSAMIEKICFHLKHHPGYTKLFISSDEEMFVRFMQENFTALDIIYRQDFARSNNKKPIHLHPGNRYDINRDAVINCLILSRCHSIIKNASKLSTFSTYINPDINVIMAGKPSNHGYPESELYTKASYCFIN